MTRQCQNDMQERYRDLRLIQHTNAITACRFGHVIWLLHNLQQLKAVQPLSLPVQQQVNMASMSWKAS